MPDSLANDIANLPERYSVTYEKITKTWRILDLRHPELAKIAHNLDDDVPDTHPAVTILTEQMFNALVASAIKNEVLNPAVAGIAADPEVKEVYKETIRTQEQELKELRQQLEKKNNVPAGTESFVLKNKIIDNLMRLAIAEGIGETR